MQWKTAGGRCSLIALCTPSPRLTNPCCTLLSRLQEPYEKKAAEDKKRYEKEKEAYEGGSKKK